MNLCSHRASDCPVCPRAPLRGSLLLEGSASAAALPTGDWLTTLTNRARSLRNLASDYVRDRPVSLEPAPSRIGSSAWFSRAWSGSASCCLEIAEGKAALVRSAFLDARPLAFSTLLTLALLQNVRSRKLL